MTFFLKLLYLTLWIGCVLCDPIPSSVSPSPESDGVVDLGSEVILKMRLLSFYSTRVAPAEPVVLTYDIIPVKVVEVDVRRGMVTVDLWLQHYWQDPRLVWDTTVYSSEILFFSANEVFVPEMALQNGVMTRTLPDPPVIVYPNGSILHFPAVRAEIYCQLPSIPFTDVICPITMGPWSHHTRYTVLANFAPAIDASVVHNTGICSIGDSWSELGETTFDCCPGIEFAFINLNLSISCSDDGFNAPPAKALNSAPKKTQTLPLDSTHKSSLPIVVAPFLVLLIFVLPQKATNRVFLGTIVFAALLFIWTTEVSPEERRFLQLSTIVAISATFASLVPCVFRSVGKPDTQIPEHGPKPSKIKNRVAIMIDMMLFAAVAIVLGICTAGTFA